MDTAEMLALGAIAVPAVGGFAMYAWNLLVQRRKSARRVLFHYLEFWNFVSKPLHWVQPDEIAKVYMDEVNAYITQHYPDTVPLDSQSVKTLVETLFGNLQGSCHSALDTEFIGSYKAALKELSEDFPVLAYSLNGREKLPGMCQIMRAHADEIKNLDEVRSSNEPTQAYVEWMGREALKDQLSELKALVSHDLLLVAKECGWLTYVEVRKMVNEPIPDWMEEFRPQLHQFIDKTLAPWAKESKSQE